MKFHQAWICLLAVTAASGCAGPSQAPQVGVGDCAVFTSVHLIAAEVSVANEANNGSGNLRLDNGPFTAAEMKRYFETRASDYDAIKTRMDSFLDGQQRQSAMFQAAQSQLTVGIAANLAANASAAGNGQTAAVAAPTGPVNQAILEQLSTVFKSLLSAPVIDSPFDQLDRVADFYAGYVIKNLRVRGDSRVVDQHWLAEQIIQLLPDSKDPKETGQRTYFESLLKKADADVDAQSIAKGSRLLLVVFQTHVDPGNMADVWAGIRLNIKGVEGGGSVDDVKVIRLHPTRFYDVDETMFGESTSRAFAAANNVSIAMPKVGVTINISGNNSEEIEARRRYLTRVSKITSFADATTHSFGFNFYPSNVRVEKQYIPFGLLLSGNATTYKTSGYLEGGARDCAAMLVLPRNTTSIRFGVANVWGHVDSGDVTTATNDRTFTVGLPEWKPVELLAATVGAGPTTQPAGSAKAGVSPSNP